MLRFMIDTDICSFILKRTNDTVLRRLRAIPVNDVCISVITKSELLYGVEVSPRRRQDGVAVDRFSAISPCWISPTKRPRIMPRSRPI